MFSYSVYCLFILLIFSFAESFFLLLFHFSSLFLFFALCSWFFCCCWGSFACFCFVLFCQHLYKACKMWLGLNLSVSQLEGRPHWQMGQWQSRPKYNKKAHIKHTRDILRTSAQVIKGTVLLGPTRLLPHKATLQRLGVKAERGKVRRQRNTPKWKKRRNSPQKN